MSHPKLLTSPLRAVSVPLLVVFACVAQEKAAVPADPDAATRDKLKQQIEDFDRKIAQADALATGEQAARAGVTVQDLGEYALRLRETRSVFEDYLDAVDALAETKKSIDRVTSEINSYTGLTEPAPYAPWVVDTYRDALDARTTQREIAARALDQAKNQAAAAAKDQKTREGEYSVANEKFATNTDPAQRATLEWTVQAGLAQRDLAQARRTYADFAVQLAQSKLDLCDKELDLADRKTKDAESKIQYRRDDLDARRAELDKARDTLAKERSAADVQRDKTKKNLESARTALDNSTEDEEYAVNQAAFDLAKAESDAAQQKSALLREQMDALYHLAEIWGVRYSLHTAPKDFPLQRQREQLTDYVDSLNASRRALETSEDVLRAGVRELGERLAQMQQSANSLDNTQKFLKIRTAQLDELARSAAAIDRTEKLTKRVLAEIAEVEQRQSIGERLQQIGQAAQRVWDRQLFEIDGQPLTIKKIGIALIILVLGFALTRMITRSLRRALRARPHFDPNASAAIERLVHYTMVALVVLFALNSVNIPLTVFTLFGGALAIGVGFGAQNLINNFISGLILMAERPIKIGDIVEVDGQRGLVAEIGARCSRIATYSGVDILVPNSVLLEKNVVNWTYNDAKARFSFIVKVAQEVNAREATRLIEKTLADHGHVLKTPGPSVLFNEILDNAFVFEVIFWLDLRATPDGRIVGSDLRHMIEHAFRDAGIPYISAPKAPVVQRTPGKEEEA